MLPTWINWITVVVGIWLIVASFVLDYTGGVFWNTLIVGIVVVVLACLVAIPKKKKETKK